MSLDAVTSASLPITVDGTKSIRVCTVTTSTTALTFGGFVAGEVGSHVCVLEMRRRCSQAFAVPRSILHKARFFRTVPQFRHRLRHLTRRLTMH